MEIHKRDILMWLDNSAISQISQSTKCFIGAGGFRIFPKSCDRVETTQTEFFFKFLRTKRLTTP